MFPADVYIHKTGLNSQKVNKSFSFSVRLCFVQWASSLRSDPVCNVQVLHKIIIFIHVLFIFVGVIAVWGYIGLGNCWLAGSLINLFSVRDFIWRGPSLSVCVVYVKDWFVGLSCIELVRTGQFDSLLWNRSDGSFGGKDSGGTRRQENYIIYKL